MARGGEFDLGGGSMIWGRQERARSSWICIADVGGVFLWVPG